MAVGKRAKILSKLKRDNEMRRKKKEFVPSGIFFISVNGSLVKFSTRRLIRLFSYKPKTNGNAAKCVSEANKASASCSQANSANPVSAARINSRAVIQPEWTRWGDRHSSISRQISSFCHTIVSAKLSAYEESLWKKDKSKNHTNFMRFFNRTMLNIFRIHFSRFQFGTKTPR